MPEQTPELCSCGNRFDGDNLCMPSACQWEGITGEQTSDDEVYMAHRDYFHRMHTCPWESVEECFSHIAAELNALQSVRSELRELLLKFHATNPELDRWLAALGGKESNPVQHGDYVV